MLNKKRKNRIWCRGGNTVVYIAKQKNGSKDFNLKQHVRCSVCGQRFKPDNRPCEQGFAKTYDEIMDSYKLSCCVTQKVPKHKAY